MHWNTGKNRPERAGRRLDRGAENLAYPWPQKVGLAGRQFINGGYLVRYLREDVPKFSPERGFTEILWKT